MDINQAIFMTNTFAEAHPQEHVRLWADFERTVPVVNRTGVFGADNLAYIKFLKERQEPVFVSFINQHVEMRGQ